jgi:hypothetical protein
VATPFDLFPTDLNWSDALTVLVNEVPRTAPDRSAIRCKAVF